VSAGFVQNSHPQVVRAKMTSTHRQQRTALVLLSLARHSPGAVRTAALDGMTVLLTVGGADPMAPNTIDGKTPPGCLSLAISARSPLAIC